MTVSVAEPTIVFALAAFPPTSSPRLSAVGLGISYEPSNLEILATATCADASLPEAAWPDSGSGIALAWTTAETDHLIELFWLAAYADTVTTLSLGGHPLHGGYFADDSIPAVSDAIASFGELGFGTDGYLPCPVAGGSGQDEPYLVPETQRWKFGSDVDVYVGRFSSSGSNLNRPDVISRLSQAAGTWTGYFADNAVEFSLIDGSQNTCPISTADYRSDMCWGYDPWPRYAWEQAALDYPNAAPWRYAAIDIHFSDAWTGSQDLCWVDCDMSHGCVTYAIDLPTISLHEWGHAIGISHAEGAPSPDWQKSIMWEDSFQYPPYCEEHDVGTLDVEFAQWMYAGLQDDNNEPDNDYPATPEYLGGIYTYGAHLSNFIDALPGYCDVDHFTFEIDYDGTGDILEIVLDPVFNENAPLTMDIYHDGEYRGTYPAWNEPYYFVTDVQTGLWCVRVRSADWFTTIPYRYDLDVYAIRPVTGIHGTDAETNTVQLHIDSAKGTLSGGPVSAPGTVMVFDASGRCLWQRTLPVGEPWTFVVDSHLPSGVYLVRASSGTASADGRLVVVR